MGNLPEVSAWEPAVSAHEAIEPLRGGVGGELNRAARQLANRTAWLRDQLEAVQQGQVAGMIAKATRADLEADLAPGDGTPAIVTNDPVPANNGAYRKSGASGAGVWVQSSFDRVALVEQDIAGYVGAGAPIDTSDLPGYAWSVQDSGGKAALGVKADGTVAAGAAEVESLSAVELTVGDDLEFAEAPLTPEFAWSVQDGSGNVALGVKNDGTVVAAGLDVDGGGTTVPAFARRAGIFTHQLNYINNTGQSLAQGSDGDLTTVQEYDSIGFRGAALNPTATYPLTVAETENGGAGESPMYGTCGHIKELVEEENGIGYAENDYQLLAGNNGSGGASIDEINKGGSRGMYERAISQAQAGYDIAVSEGRTFAFQAVTWTQGEADATNGMSKADYLAKLLQLAADYNTDGKAITGQHNDVQFITYQLGRPAGFDTVIAALLEASERMPYIHLATPIYFMAFYDGTHITAESSKWLGGYYGLVYKRVVVDGKGWAPLKPVHHSVIGNAIDLQFNKEGLVFDTTLMPAQANHGFTVFNELGVAVAISSVAIVGPNRVRITCASAPQPGWRVKYGHIAVTGRADYSGGGGNLRDSQGDRVVYAAINKPMHNWCILFNYEV